MKLSESTNNLANVLLAEDSIADIELVRFRMDVENVILNLNVVRDGDEVIDYLNKEPPFENEPTPDLIFLDLNLPKRNGRDILSYIKQDSKLRDLHVVVLSGSTNDKDKDAANELGAKCYIEKPLCYKKLQEVVALLDNVYLDEGDTHISLCKIGTG